VPQPSLHALIALFLVFAGLSLWVYRGALAGPFVSDDSLLITENPLLPLPLHRMLPAVFAPTGEGRFRAGGNYAPMLHLAHALEVRIFGGEPRGYHVVNVLLHAGNALLLGLLLLRAGLARGVCLAASALFLLHPANVEAVAWISQLRTLLALAGALGALLLLQSRPLASAALFAAGLLAKASASFALPMAAVFLYAQRRRGEPTGTGMRAFALWLAAFAVYAPIQYGVFSSLARAFGDPYPELWTHLRSIAAIGARYLAMAATGHGLSAFHEPPPVRSSLDPWWLAGIVLGIALTLRIVATLRRAEPEAGWWLGAAAAFAPVSQALPFMFGMADRYLYFILPGLLGGACLAGGALWRRVAPRLSASGRAGLLVWLPRAAFAGALVWAAAFGLHASQRAHLWRGGGYLLEDAAARYPDGAIGHYVRGVLALERGDPDSALESLRASAERGGTIAHPFFGDPWLLPLHGDPRFRALIADAAQMAIDEALERKPTTQTQMYILASSYYLRAELDETIYWLEEAARIGGPMQGDVLQLLERVRLERSGKAQTDAYSAVPKTGPKPVFDFPSERRLGPDEWPEP
jgi:hypothetical protein